MGYAMEARGSRFLRIERGSSDAAAARPYTCHAGFSARASGRPFAGRAIPGVNQHSSELFRGYYLVKDLWALRRDTNLRGPKEVRRANECFSLCIQSLANPRDRNTIGARCWSSSRLSSMPSRWIY